MNRMSLQGKAILLSAIIVSLASGIQLKTENENVSLNVTGDAAMHFGQAMNYFYRNNREFHHQWIQQSLMHLGVDASYGEKVNIKLGMEGRLWFSLPDQAMSTTGQAYALYDKIFSYSIYEACGSYLFGDTGSRSLSITGGLFRYKYNQEIKNLGEFLFRSLAYPAVLINYFDMTDARLAGIRLSGDLPAGNLLKFHGDLMLTFETEIYPFYDVTPSLIGECTIGKFLDVGMGVAFSRLFPVNDSLTTPQSPSYPRNRYINGNDTGYYTFGGTKLMVRFTFDPKPFIPLTWFGPEDLKLYSEAALLGLESYPRNDTINSPAATDANIWGYDTLWQKIPVVIGFNVPTFKILDVFSLEFEWYGCAYPMSLKDAVKLQSQIALPIPSNAYGRSYDMYTKDNWKWSVYAKKMFAHEHLGIIVQFARDHLRFQHILDEPKVYEEALIAPNQWWWTMKLVARF